MRSHLGTGRELSLAGQVHVVGANLLGGRTRSGTGRNDERTERRSRGTRVAHAGDRFKTCMSSNVRWRRSGVPYPPLEGVWALRGRQVDFEQFEQRILALLAMDDGEYADRSRTVARHFVAYDVERPACEVVKTYLHSILKLAHSTTGPTVELERHRLGAMFQGRTG